MGLRSELCEGHSSSSTAKLGKPFLDGPETCTTKFNIHEISFLASQSPTTAIKLSTHTTVVIDSTSQLRFSWSSHDRVHIKGQCLIVWRVAPATYFSRCWHISLSDQNLNLSLSGKVKETLPASEHSQSSMGSFTHGDAILSENWLASRCLFYTWWSVITNMGVQSKLPRWCTLVNLENLGLKP